MSPHLSERARRIWLGAEARQLGRGGIKFVALVTGAAIETVRSGIAGLGKDPGGREEGRVRRPGGGRKKAEDKDPGLPAALDALLGDDKSEAGDPMTPRLRWTSKSLARLSDELNGQGRQASPAVVRRLMRQRGWRLQSNDCASGDGGCSPTTSPWRRAPRTRTGMPSSATSASGPRGSPPPGGPWSAWMPRRRIAGRELHQRRAGMGPRRGGAAGPGP